MKLLAIDTATEACSAALYLDGEIDTRFEVCPQQHSQKLLPMVDDLLKSRQLTIQDMDYLVYGRGPGSFTGVRIATGLVQGLSLGADLQVAGVSTLATMAQQAITLQQAQYVAVAIDARMDEVYFAQFKNENGVAILVGEEQVIPPSLVSAQLASNSAHLCGTGWQAYPELNDIVEQHNVPTILYPDAAYTFELAKMLIQTGQICDTEAVKPVYLRDKVTWKKLPGRE